MDPKDLVGAVLNALMQMRPDITLTPEEQQNLVATVVAGMSQPEQAQATAATTLEEQAPLMKAIGPKVAEALTKVIEAKEAARKALNGAAANAVKGLMDAALPPNGRDQRPGDQNA